MRKKKESKRPWLRKPINFAKWLAIACFATILVGYLVMRLDFVSNSNRLPAEIAAAKELGIPLEPSQMKRNPPVPDVDNAALVYARASKAVRAQPRSVTEVQMYDHYTLTGEKDYAAAVKSALAKVGPSLDEVRTASRLPFCDFKVNWNDPAMAISFTELASLKNHAKWLAFRSFVRANEGNWDGAIQDATAIYRIAVHVGQEPMLIAALVDIALDTIASRLFEQLATMAANDADILSRLAKAIEEAPPIPSFKYYLRGEAFLGYRMATELEENWSRDKLSYFDSNYWQGDLKLYTIYPPLVEPDLVEKANSARVLAYWNEILSSIDANSRSPIEMQKVIVQTSKRFVENSKQWYGFSDIQFYDFSNVGSAFERARMQRETVRTLIEVLRFKKSRDRLPVRLEETGPVAMDSFSNKPLHYRLTKNGFRVWSRGPDRKGFGGRLEWEYDDQNVRNTDEIVAAYPATDRMNAESKARALENWRRRVYSSP